MRKEPGCVYLVGAGPGDTGLLTVKGAGLLRCCDCVVYDHLASEQLLDGTPAACERIFVGKQKGHHWKSQEMINQILIQKAREYGIVVRLKGGDPYVFGRGGEEAIALAEAGIPYEVVPGVSSAVAVPAAAGIPITHRRLSRSFHVITGHTKADGGLPEDFYHLGDCRGTVVFLMGVSQLGRISRGLMEQGWAGDTPAAVVQNGTLPDQKAVRGNLADIEEKAEAAGIGTPAVIVVGETAGLMLLSGQKRPLEGIRIGITGTDRFAGRLKELLECLGARVQIVCRMEVVPIENSAVEESYRRLDQYTWMVFTSANGVRLYLDGLLERNLDLRCLGRIKLAAIGKGTKEALRAYYLRADYVPETYSSRELALGLLKRLTKQDRVLIPRALKGSPELPQLLSQGEIPFCNLPIYDVTGRKISACRGREEESYDFLVFASASGVAAYFQDRPEVGKARICCIGAATAGELQRCGYEGSGADIAEEASAEGIVKRILEIVQKDNSGTI